MILVLFTFAVCTLSNYLIDLDIDLNLAQIAKKNNFHWF